MDEQKNEVSVRQICEAWLKGPKQKDPKKDQGFLNGMGSGLHSNPSYDVYDDR